MMRKFDLIPRAIIVKAALVIILAVISVSLLLTGRNLVHDNKTMLKLIKNEGKLGLNFNKIQENEAVFSQFYISLDNKSDREKIKADTAALIMKIIETNNLKVDSYRSELEEAGDFTLFKYNITIVGKYPDVVSFFSLLAQDARNVYVTGYTIKLYTETSVRVGLQMELLGVPST